ncbi:hypothetical protein DT035_08640 [Bacillus subtilis]|uniref:hypothetical protein n=1 Tax=Bacillus subtilis TaxID=1423 RepID=UPI00145A7428|nr:hypothetical protein [Bacillus subtilis]MBA5714898.1 hypothetical protein [Bacillus subtilis]QNK37964.1 hypothetical protein H8S71_06365 [Bacillus subtilis subsp. subtilis]
MEPVNYLKDMLGIAEGTIVDTAIDVGLEAIPTVGQALQSYKIKKLEKRMNTHEPQLQIIKEKIENSENEVFYKQEVFPLIVKSLMEDDEELKAKVIIDGFEYVIDNDLHDIERIYHYYDVLDELRFSDMMRFVYYMPQDAGKELKLKINLATSEEQRTSSYQEGKAIQVYQLNKLIRLGLIEQEIVGIDGGSFDESESNDFVQHKTQNTDFGKRFFEFFALDKIVER